MKVYGNIAQRSHVLFIATSKLATISVIVLVPSDLWWVWWFPTSRTGARITCGRRQRLARRARHLPSRARCRRAQSTFTAVPNRPRQYFSPRWPTDRYSPASSSRDTKGFSAPGLRRSRFTNRISLQPPPNPLCSRLPSAAPAVHTGTLARMPSRQAGPAVALPERRCKRRMHWRRLIVAC